MRDKNVKYYNGIACGYEIKSTGLNKTFKIPNFGIRGINVPVKIKEVTVTKYFLEMSIVDHELIEIDNNN
jgi:hypothetical protein